MRDKSREDLVRGLQTIIVSFEAAIKETFKVSNAQPMSATQQKQPEIMEQARYTGVPVKPVAQTRAKRIQASVTRPSRQFSATQPPATKSK